MLVDYGDIGTAAEQGSSWSFSEQTSSRAAGQRSVLLSDGTPRSDQSCCRAQFLGRSPSSGDALLHRLRKARGVWGSGRGA